MWKKIKEFIFVFFLFLVTFCILITLQVYNKVQITTLFSFSIVMFFLLLKTIFKKIIFKYLLSYPNLIGYVFFVFLKFGLLMFPILGIYLFWDDNDAILGTLIGLGVYLIYNLSDYFIFALTKKEKI